MLTGFLCKTAIPRSNFNLTFFTSIGSKPASPQSLVQPHPIWRLKAYSRSHWNEVWRILFQLQDSQFWEHPRPQYCVVTNYTVVAREACAHIRVGYHGNILKVSITFSFNVDEITPFFMCIPVPRGSCYPICIILAVKRFLCNVKKDLLVSFTLMDCNGLTGTIA